MHPWSVCGWAILALSLYAGLSGAQVIDTSELRTTQPLMENWRFVQDDAMTDAAALASAAQDWQVVSLPHTWNAQDAANLEGTSYKRGLGWYHVEFATPPGARHWLEFGAASLVADVWLNGQYLGQHKGGFTAFRFDITDRLAPGATNVLLVKTDNSVPVKRNDITAIAPLGGDFNVSGGLYRQVALISTADVVHFDLGDLGGPGVYAATTSIVDGLATIQVHTKLANDSAAAGDYVARISLLGADGQLAATSDQAVSLPAGVTELVQDLSVPSPHLWQGVADPYLYQLVAEVLRSDGAPLDRVVQSFGIRQARFDPNQGFFLNGQHVRLHGVSMHQDLLGKGWAISDADMDASLALFAEIGANAIRLGHYPFDRHALERIDQIGLIAYAETALGLGVTVEPKQCSRRSADEAFVANATQQLREMIRQQYNHPSIVMWSVGNETSARQIGCKDAYDNVTPVLRTMHETAKSEDSLRPTVYSEFPHPVQRSGPFATEGITDLFATNRYFLWYQEPFERFGPLLDELHALTAGQPLGISEYGAGAALTQHSDNPMGGLPEVHGAPAGQTPSFNPEEYASYVHEKNYGLIETKPYLWGAFAWNMFDFGSANHREGDVLGVNTKGLVAFDHQTRKDPFYFYKANWSSEPVTYVTSRRYTNRAYPVADVKVYSNADSVELSANGAVVGTLSAAQCVQRTCIFKNVSLKPGSNTLTATGNHAGVPVSDTVEWSLSSTDINISAGRLATGYVSSAGELFGSDNFFTGGVGKWLGTGDPEGGTPPPVASTNDPLLYKYYRTGQFRYDVPVPDGVYTVTLGFVEPNRALGIGERIFDVSANGRALLSHFDVLQAAGAARTAVSQTFTIDVSGGILTLEFTPVARKAVVSNIRIKAVSGS